MATEPNTLVSAERAQAILDVCSVYPVGYPPIVAASVQLQKATCALLEAVPDLAETVIALHAEVKRLSTANIDLLDTLRAVARACTLPEDTAPASLPAQVEDCLRDLSGQIERRTRERDHAVAKAQQFARVLAGAATVEDAVQLLSAALVEDAASAPNCAEWRGSYSGREFAITVQWVDGKSPHALIDEARRERDDLRTQLATVTAALDSERAVTRETAELRSLRQREIAALLPDDPAQWSPVDIASALVQARQEIARLQLTATATTDAEEALAGLVALKPAASRAYLEMDGGRTDTITPEEDSGAEPRLALTFDLGGTEGGEPWQALVIYDAGMGTVPVIAGECCESPRAAVASLREDLEPNHDADDDTEGDSCG